MTEQKIHELLKHYFDGGTSLAEERLLQQFFAKEKVPESLKVYRPLFTFFTEEQAVEPPKKETKTRSIWLIVSGIAASIAIFFLVTLSQQEDNGYTYYVSGERIHDKAAAIESAESKLQMLAVSMQKAQKSMAAFGKVQESGMVLQQINKIPDAFQHVEKVISGTK